MKKSTLKIENLKIKIQEINAKIRYYEQNKHSSSSTSQRKSDIKKLNDYLGSLKQSLNEQEKFIQNINLSSNTESIVPYDYNKKIYNHKTKKGSFSKSLTHMITVPWENIFFFDNELKIKIGDRKFLKFASLLARKSYDTIKMILIKRNLPPLDVFIINGKISKIINLDHFHNVIKILEIQHIWNDIYQKPSLELKNNLKKISENLNTAFFDSVLNITDRSVYINYLCTIQDINFPIVPVFSEFGK